MDHVDIPLGLKLEQLNNDLRSAEDRINKVVDKLNRGKQINLKVQTVIDAQNITKMQRGLEQAVSKMKLGDAQKLQGRFQKELQSKISLNADISSIERTRVKLNTVESALRGIKKEAEPVNKSLSDFIPQLKGVAAGFGLAFGASQIAGVLKDSVRLAAETEGVRAAFDKLNRPDLLNNLKDATRGTVAELDLMKAAVKANNFQIPLEQMATLLEFAQKRANQTGESIDNLVESIVLGIGRKSPLILDNLGISAIRLREKFGDLGVESASVGDVAKAVGEIVEEEFTAMGEVAITTKDRFAQLAAQIKNTEALIGEGLIGATMGAMDIMEGFAAAGVHGASAYMSLNAQMRAWMTIVAEIDKMNKGAVSLVIKQATETAKAKNAEQLGVLVKEIEAKINALKKLGNLDADQKNDIEQQEAKLKVYQQTIEKLNFVFDSTGKSVAQIKQRITELQAAQDNLVPGTEAYKKNVAEIAKLEAITSKKSVDLSKEKESAQKKYYDEVKFLDEGYWEYKETLMNQEADELAKVLDSQFDREKFLIGKRKRIKSGVR